MRHRLVFVLLMAANYLVGSAATMLFLMATNQLIRPETYQAATMLLIIAVLLTVTLASVLSLRG